MTSRSGGIQRGHRSSTARGRISAPPPTLRRSSAGSPKHDAGGRVRVAVRLRPQNQEEMVEDADFADCVELQPELKRLRLRKNNWDFDTYEFDEVLTEFASQKRVYEVVAKPVVESVLEGYNGTVMAYGQTGTGKTHTLGRLGEEDTSARGIMVRSMEDILASISPQTDSISVSYLQLYMETIQDLLDPMNDNIAIVEDPKTGDVSVPGATSVDIRDEHSFMELLRLGEAHRIAANTKLNTESSRSHAILMVQIRKSVVESGAETNNSSHVDKSFKPLVRKGKFVVVDLAGSERVHKSGSEGHVLEEAKSINLSLSALGKCINALAENSTHVPVRDSKLTRLLKDSFGGTARTSLVVTIGPSPRHRGETASTILFGQRAMKVENMLKIKEEFDYKSLSRKLEMQLDAVIAENERRQKTYKDELGRVSIEAQKRITEAERNCIHAFEREKLKYQMEYMDSVKKLEEKLMNGQSEHGHNVSAVKPCNRQMNGSEEVMELKRLLQNETRLRQEAEEEASRFRSQLEQFMHSEDGSVLEIFNLRRMLEDEIDQKRKLEEELAILRSQLLQSTYNSDQMRRGGNGDGFSGLDSLMSQFRNSQLNETGNGQKAPMTTLFEQVGLQKILALLESEDASVRIHAVKVVANLAAEESNQELIMAEGGIGLLSMTAADADDAQTLRMVAGAIANLCGNDKLQKRLRSEGGIKALLGMVRCGHSDVLSQIARGIANFAKCESRASTQGRKTGRSFLIEDGALPWIVQNANNEAAPIRRHIELALCHLAQHEVNAKDMIDGGALWELVRISRDCSREDIRTLAHRSLSASHTFRSEMRRLRIEL
uniref:Kinesin-like protein n=1 Tax=Kalanchoe fedtschenkoi TaxID=63787 RepID=A0A7N0SZG6_KALFE